MTTLRHLAAALLLAGSLTAVHAQSLRPEVGKPLQQASDLLRAGKANEALAKVGEADRASNKSPAETLMIERMRGAAAQRAGDNATAAKAFEAAFATGKLNPAEQTQMAESLAFTYSQLKDNAKANQWVQKAQALGSTSPQLKQLAAYLQASGGDYGAIAKNAAAAVAASEQAGKRPEEADLLRLADAYQHTNNAAGQYAALEKLVANYPKKEYWSALLGRIQRKPGFSDRFAVDVLRLKLATGNLTSADDYMELAQLALQAGYAPEGKAVVDKGMAAGVLGVGAEAARHKRLLDLAVKQEQEGKAHLAQEVEQARVVMWSTRPSVRVHMPQLKWLHHSPNGGVRDSFTGAQLKVIQEVISLLVFAGFSVWWLGEALRWNHLGAFFCLVGAVWFMFAG